MTRVASAPFLQSLPVRIRPGGWEIHVDGTWRDMGDRVPEWDYATEVNVRRRFDIDADEVRRDCQLPPDTPLAFSVSWHASSTNRRAAFPAAPIDDDHATVLGTLAGAELGGQLHLRSQLILTRAVETPAPLSPRRPGSILWGDVESVHLEGGAALFPIELIDFAETGIAPSAACWYLDWNPADLTAATLGSLRLFVNSVHPALRRATANPDADELTAAITTAIRHDILRQLIEGALDSTDFDERTHYPAGTLGSSMRVAVRLGFGGGSVDTVRALRRAARAEFEARIQAAAGLFGE